MWRPCSTLISDQFPQWSHLDIEPVQNPGWDNVTFHLGEDLLVRLPSAAEYALAVEKEQQWLPRLAPSLSVPIPSVRGLGVPGAGYPFAWSVYDWIDGSPATQADIADQAQFVEQLADFLVSLRSIDPADGPAAGHPQLVPRRDSPHLRRYGSSSLGRVDRTHRRNLAAEVWADALDAPWDGADVWFHGDLAEGNLLLRDGQLAAVIDFGTCGVGRSLM